MSSSSLLSRAVALIALLLLFLSGHAYSQTPAADPFKALSGDFTIIYEAATGGGTSEDRKKDLSSAIRQYDEMYQSHQIDKPTHDSFVSALKRSHAEQAKPKTYTITLSGSEKNKALLCKETFDDQEIVSLFTENDKRTFNASSKADLAYVFQGLRPDHMPGIFPLAGAIRDISFIFKPEKTNTTGVFRAYVVDTRLASKEPVYSFAYVTVAQGDLVNIRMLAGQKDGPTRQEWKYSAYRDESGMRLPSNIEFITYSTSAGSYGKPESRIALRLKEVSILPADDSAFSYDTYLVGRKGVQFDDGKSVISFPYQQGVPIDIQAKAETLRRMTVTGGGTNATPTYGGAVALLAVVVGAAWFSWRRWRGVQLKREVA